MSAVNQRPNTAIDGRLAAYAALVGAALAAPAMSKADIVYSGIVNISVPNNFDGIYINFVTGETGSSGSSVPGWNWNPYNGGTGLQFFWNGPAPNINGGLSLDQITYAVLPAGSGVGPANTYLNTTSATATANWRAGADAYLGIRLLNSQTNQINYGWVHFDTTGSTGFPATIIEYAYDNMGNPIVPEPSTTALLGVMAAGALAMRGWRTRSHRRNE